MSTPLKTMMALVRRELWENRAFWTVPATVAGVLTVLMVWGGVEFLQTVSPEDIAEANADIAQAGVLATVQGQVNHAALAFVGISLAIGLIMSIVAAFYLLDCLYGDRRDRSILFWRSMPITDTQTVLSKLATATLAAPALMIAVLAVAFVVWGAIAAGFGLAAGLDHWYIGLNPLAYLSAIVSLVGIALGMALVLAPFTGWLVLASAWAPRAPFLWAAVPVAAVAVLEEMLFDSHHFMIMVVRHTKDLLPKLFGDNFEGIGIRGDEHHGMRVVGEMDLSGALLLEPRLWIGVAIGAAFIALAIRARRVRDDVTY